MSDKIFENLKEALDEIDRVLKEYNWNTEEIYIYCEDNNIFLCDEFYEEIYTIKIGEE